MFGIGLEAVSRVGFQYLSWCVFAVTFGLLYYDNRAQKINEIRSKINEEREIKRQEEESLRQRRQAILDRSLRLLQQKQSSQYFNPVTASLDRKGANLQTPSDTSNNENNLDTQTELFDPNRTPLSSKKYLGNRLSAQAIQAIINSYGSGKSPPPVKNQDSQQNGKITSEVSESVSLPAESNAYDSHNESSSELLASTDQKQPYDLQMSPLKIDTGLAALSLNVHTEPFAYIESSNKSAISQFSDSSEYNSDQNNNYGLKSAASLGGYTDDGNASEKPKKSRLSISAESNAYDNPTTDQPEPDNNNLAASKKSYNELYHLYYEEDTKSKNYDFLRSSAEISHENAEGGYAKLATASKYYAAREVHSGYFLSATTLPADPFGSPAANNNNNNNNSNDSAPKDGQPKHNRRRSLSNVITDKLIGYKQISMQQQSQQISQSSQSDPDYGYEVQTTTPPPSIVVSQHVVNTTSTENNNEAPAPPRDTPDLLKPPKLHFQMRTSTDTEIESEFDFDGDLDLDQESMELDWNERFQRAVKRIRKFNAQTPLSERILANLNLLQLARDFLFTAQMYGKVIISERYLTPEQKTIRPVPLPGVLGGEKYIVCGILFKFAVDRDGLFGSDYAAAKVAGHDLKGLMHYFNLGLDIHVPLMCLVDYRGFRLIAMSILPINHKTIIYGTCDAGRSVHCKDTSFTRVMKKAAEMLNIKAHLVGNQLLFSPADLEGHYGVDNRYYLLDFSRVFPPEAPIQSIKNAHLSRLLRPEFVSSYSTPLCSDAFSGFIRGHHKEANSEILDATDHLLRVLIPKFAKGELTNMMLESNRLEDFRLTETVHRQGINCRYLGVIRHEIETPNFKQVILIEILARVLKNNLRLRLRLKMKKLKKPLEEPYRRLVINYLNLVFGNSQQSTTYWNVNLKDDVRRNFIMTFTDEEMSDRFSLKPEFTLSEDGMITPDSARIFLSTLLRRLEKMLGMKLSVRVHKHQQLFKAEFPFNDTDLESLPLRIKHMNIVNFAEGFFYHIKGLTSRVDDIASAQKFYSMAIEKFEEALDSNPENKEINLTLALTWTFILEDIFSSELAQGETFPRNHPAVIKATEYYLRAISAPPKYDAHTLFMYAYFLERAGNFDGAEEYYLQSLEQDPGNAACLLQYGNFLSELGTMAEAEEFWLRSSEHTKGYKTFEWNYWGNFSKLSAEIPRVLTPQNSVSSLPYLEKNGKSDSFKPGN